MTLKHTCAFADSGMFQTLEKVSRDIGEFCLTKAVLSQLSLHFPTVKMKIMDERAEKKKKKERKKIRRERQTVLTISSSINAVDL